MVQYLWLIPLGFVVGAFGTLIGAGGGFILVPLLLILYPHAQPEIITSISLAVVFFNALSGSWAYGRMKRIHYRAGIQFAIAGIPGAILGALTTYYVPRRAFDLICGVLMLGMAGYLLWRPDKASGNGTTGAENGVVPLQDIRYNPWLGAGISLGVGYVSSLLGIGGGIIHVPVLVHLLNFPVHYATATSHFVLAAMAFTGTGVHIATGAFHEGVRRTICLSVGVVLGAQLGALLSERLRGALIVRSLAVALVFVGVRVLLLVL